MDTNVVLDLWLFRNPGLVWLASAVASGSLQWVATAAMLEELSHVRIRRFGAHHSAMSVCAWVSAFVVTKTSLASCQNSEVFTVEYGGGAPGSQTSLVSSAKVRFSPQ